MVKQLTVSELERKVKKLERSCETYRKANERLKASEETLRAIIDSIPCEVFAIDPDGRYCMENAAVRKHWGSVIGRHLEDFARSRDVQRVWEEHNRRALAGETVDHLAQYRLDGKTVFCRTMLAPLTQGRSRTGIVGINVDYTAHRETELTLRKTVKRLESVVQKQHDELARAIELLGRSDSRYQFLYEFAPFPLVEADTSALQAFLDELRTQGVRDIAAYLEEHPDLVNACAAGIKIVNANDTMVKVFKAGTRKKLLRNHAGIYTGESYESMREGILAYSQGRNHFETEVACQTFEGERKWFILQWSVLPEFRNSRTRMLGSFIDITGRKKIEEDLRTFKRISDASAIGNAIISPQGRFMYVNAAFAGMHGYREEELIGKSTLDVLAENQIKTIKKMVAEMNRMDMLKNVEMWYRKRDGSIFPMLVNASIMKNARGKVRYIALSSVDVSKLKDLEQALRRRGEELEAQIRKQEEMNNALKVLLEQRDRDRIDVEERVIANVRELVLPLVRKVRNSTHMSRQQSYLNLLEEKLQEIIAPLSRQLVHLGLTKSETLVATLLREGRTSKEIADLLSLSERSVDTYRTWLRKKLGLTNKKISLTAYLRQFG